MAIALMTDIQANRDLEWTRERLLSPAQWQFLATLPLMVEDASFGESTRQLTFRPVPYDHVTAALKVSEACLPGRLATVLLHGGGA